MTPGEHFVELDKNVHDRSSFDCGADELNLFLRQYAARHRAAGISMTMVLPAVDDETRICAYYTLSHTGIKRQSLPEPAAKQLPYYPVPVILIAQFAVHVDLQGQGLGKVALVGALHHAHEINKHLPSFAVIVDVLQEEVRGFYEQYGFELLDMQNQRSRLFIPMKTVAQLFD